MIVSAEEVHAKPDGSQHEEQRVERHPYLRAVVLPSPLAADALDLFFERKFFWCHKNQMFGGIELLYRLDDEAKAVVLLFKFVLL